MCAARSRFASSMNGRLSASERRFHSAPSRLEISELCILGLSSAMRRRWPRDHTMNAFIGRLMRVNDDDDDDDDDDGADDAESVALTSGWALPDTTPPSATSGWAFSDARRPSPSKGEAANVDDWRLPCIVVIAAADDDDDDIATAAPTPVCALPDTR